MRNLVVFVALGLFLYGCGKEGEESLAKRTGDKLGQTVTEFASGVGKGVDSQMQVNVELSEALTQSGFSKTIAKSLDPGNEKGISVYITSRDAFEGKFIATAINKEGQEIGRSVVGVSFKPDDAQYVRFIFDKEVDMQLVERFVVDMRQEAASDEVQDQRS